MRFLRLMGVVAAGVPTWAQMAAIPIQIASPETSTITAAGFNEQREFIGLVLVRVP